MTEEDRWSKFYEATKDREPRPLLLEGLKQIDDQLPKVAIDVGFGSGNETRALLDLGWEVTAIDAEEMARDILKDKVGDNSRLQIIIDSYENINYHPTSLVHAGFSLPFCHPDNFGEVWTSITTAITPEGVFCGQLFGVEDEWSDNPDMTFHSRTKIDELFSKFNLIKVEETNGIKKTATGNDKHWHYYDIIAKKQKA